jgi:hypothetical protein
MLEEKWYRTRQYVPDILVRCRHGTNPACECVTRFNVDKTCPLTRQQRIATAAKFEQNRMERLSEHDERKYRLLTQISQCEENVETIHDNEYESCYGCLTPSSPIKPQKFNIFSIIVIILVLFSIVLIIMVNPNTWHPIKYLYIHVRAVFASYHMIIK